MNTDTDAVGHAPTTRDKLAADIAAAAGDARELLKEFSDGKLRRARRALLDAQSAITGRAGDIGTVAGGYAHAHPWRTVGLAGAAGLLLGVLLARR